MVYLFLAEGAELVLLADLYPAKILDRDWGSIPPPSAILNPKPGVHAPRNEKNMALYKYKEFIELSNDEAFDKLISPSTAAPWPGIYRCHACGHEIATAQSHMLPPQNHHQHRPGLGAIQWRLVVSHKKY